MKGISVIYLLWICRIGILLQKKNSRFSADVVNNLGISRECAFRILRTFVLVVWVIILLMLVHSVCALTAITQGITTKIVHFKNSLDVQDARNLGITKQIVGRFLLTMPVTTVVVLPRIVGIIGRRTLRLLRRIGRNMMIRRLNAFLVVGKDM